MPETPVSAGHTATTMAEAVVDLNAIAHNTRILSSAAKPAAMMAVVKANAFGHGATEVARTALASGATWLGVAFAAEALALRDAGITAPLLFWLPPPPEAMEALLAANSVRLSPSFSAAGTRSRRFSSRVAPGVGSST